MHKNSKSFHASAPCRLINLCKSDIGKIIKQILKGISNNLLAKLNINQWRDTSHVIDWFKQLECKSESKFIQVDIKEYYLSITEETFNKAISFALNHTVVSCEDIRIIKHSRKSLLFHLEQAWKKKESSSCFDVTMGSYDRAELGKLIGILMQLVFELIFNESKHQYEDALRKRGFNSKLTYRDSTAPPNKKMIRKKRKIIWFNLHIIKMCQQILPKFS